MMLASNIHAYVTGIKLDPTVVWETLELQLDDLSEVKDVSHLRRLLAESIVTYLDMAHDDEDSGYAYNSSFYTFYVRKLLESTLPLTWAEQRTILGAAAWWGNGTMIDEVRELVNRPVLPPKDA